MSAEGFAMIPNWLVRDTTVSAHAKVVFVVLASHTSAAGATFVGHTLIASEAGISVSSVQRALRELRDRGALTWRQRRDARGDLTTNEYRIRVTSGHEDQGSGQGDRTVRSEGPDRPVRVTDEADVLEADVPEARDARARGVSELLTGAGLAEEEHEAFVADLRRGGVRSPSAAIASMAKDGRLQTRVAEYRAPKGSSRMEQNKAAVVRGLLREFGSSARMQANFDVVRRMAEADDIPLTATPVLELEGAAS